jgi:chromosome segregation ATPase
LEINTVVIRHKEQLQSRVSDEVESKERQISRLNAELQTLKNNLAVVEEDRNYQEETNRRVSNDLNTLRVQFSSV